MADTNKLGDNWQLTQTRPISGIDSRGQKTSAQQKQL